MSTAIEAIAKAKRIDGSILAAMVAGGWEGLTQHFGISELKSLASRDQVDIWLHIDEVKTFDRLSAGQRATAITAAHLRDRGQMHDPRSTRRRPRQPVHLRRCRPPGS